MTKSFGDLLKQDLHNSLSKHFVLDTIRVMAIVYQMNDVAPGVNNNKYKMENMMSYL